MKKFFAIIFKDLLVRFTSPSEWLFFLILPIVFTLVIGGSTGPGGDDRIKILLVDEAQNSLSQTLKAELEKSSSIRPVIVEKEDALDQFDQRKVSTVLIIPSTFTQAALLDNTASLDLHQLPNNTNSMIARQAIQSVLGRISSTVDIANASLAKADSLPDFKFKSEEARTTFYDNALTQAQTLMDEAPARIVEVRGNTKDSINFDANTNASAGQLITWVFIPLIALSSSFAYERQKGTLRRLLTTPTTKAMFLGATITGQVLTALLQAFLLVLFGIFVMKLNWDHAPLALAVMLVAATLAAAAFGTMLGTFVKTEGQASGLSIMLGMVMALMGGCWYPMELFPQTVQQVVKILPTTWAMEGLLDIVLRGHGLTAILPEAGVLLGFALIFFLIGILRFKYE